MILNDGIGINKGLNFGRIVYMVKPFIEILKLRGGTIDVAIILSTCSILLQIDFRAILLLLSGVMVHSGGDVVNDIYDRHIDKICKPNSPIASGRMSVRTAWTYMAMLYLTSIVIAASLNYLCVLLAVLGIIIGGFLYSHPKFRIKDNPILSITSLALCFALEAVATWSIYAPITTDTLIISLYAFTFVFSLMFFKDFKDVKGDVNSLPLMLGIKKAAIVVSALSVLPVLLMLFLLFFYKTLALASTIIVYVPIEISAIRILLNDPVTNGQKLRSRMYLLIFLPSSALFLTTFFF